ncbi:MAG: hypothetical protein GX458_21845 [Phyllobacteriaceae bacterium]|nr:hypothetical protein [Phyllobacteriaceae bacterium]
MSLGMDLDEPHEGRHTPFMRLVSFRLLFSIPFARRSARALGLMLVVALVVGPPSGRAAERPTEAATVASGRVGEGIAALERDLAAAETPEAAIAIRKRLVRARLVSGSTTADLLAARAATAKRQGDGGLALDLLDAAIVVAPNWAGGRHLRGAIHAERGEFAAAVVDLGEALARDPADAATLVLLAFLRERAGEKAAALELMKRAAAADPQLPDLAEPIARLTIDVEGRPI